MCIGNGSSGTPAYTPPPVTPSNATRPDEADAEVESAKISAQKKALAASGSEEDKPDRWTRSVRAGNDQKTEPARRGIITFCIRTETEYGAGTGKRQGEAQTLQATPRRTEGGAGRV